MTFEPSCRDKVIHKHSTHIKQYANIVGVSNLVIPSPLTVSDDSTHCIRPDCMVPLPMPTGVTKYIMLKLIMRAASPQVGRPVYVRL